MSRRASYVFLFTTSFLAVATTTVASRLQLIEHKELSETIGEHTGPLSPLDESPTKLFIVRTEEDAKRMAALHATSAREIMFTTYSFTHRSQYTYDAIHQARHVWECLREIGRLSNAIMLTYDVHSCQVMWEHGIPCFLDRYLPQPNELPGQYGSAVPHWYQKYAWGLKFMQWGYSCNFFETDMVFFKDPLPYRNPNLDLQGLSDWHLATVPAAKERFTGTCSVYHMQRGDHGENFLEWGPHDPENIRSQSNVNPCMSTGYWFASPKQPVIEFFDAFIDLMLHWRDWQTDQLLWNEVIMAFLIGQEHRQPMAFSLLDVQFFSNFEVYNWRKEQNLNVDPVLLHTGAMPGWQKEPYLKEHGYWKADKWKKLNAAGHIIYLLQHMNRTLP